MINLFKKFTPAKLFQSHHFSLFSTRISKSHVIGGEFKEQIDLSTAQVLLKMTERDPSKIAVYSYQQNRNLTYEELTNKAIQLANTLVNEYQLKPKERIGVYSFNKWEWYVIQLAAAFADLILVNINPAYRPEELAYTLEKVRIRVLFFSDVYRKSNYLQILKDTIPEITHKNVNPYQIHSKQFPFVESLVRMNPEGDESKEHGFVNFTNLFHAPPSMQKLPPMPSCHDMTNIQFTSGTTGLPKAATLSHFNILNNGYSIGKRCGYTEKDNICVPVPLYHCFGMVLANLAALTRGAQLTYVGEGFDPEKSIEAASKYKCTAMYGVPTMFSEYLRIYEANPSKYDISNLRTGIIAGSLAPELLMQKILTVLGVKQITNCYGMTETSPVSFQTKHTDSFENKTKTVGTILDGLQAKIVDSQGKTCPVGTPGEFVVKGWAVMSEYWEDEVATNKSIVDGWMFSGDVGVFNEQGFLSIVGRNKDMIIRGGENVYPKEIEEFLNKRLAGIIDTQVVSVSDDKFGQEIAAVIKVPDLKNMSLKKQQILHACKDKIAHYKVPKYIKFVEEYPLTVTGKIQKFIIRQELEDEKKRNGLASYAIR